MNGRKRSGAGRKKEKELRAAILHSRENHREPSLPSRTIAAPPSPERARRERARESLSLRFRQVKESKELIKVSLCVSRAQGQYLSSEDDFFRNTVVKGYYKNHVKTVLTRYNTMTGVPYRDDPTIMAWELMNEARCPSDLSGRTIQVWVTEMASYVKSIDRNHLLEAGLEGFYGESSPQRKQYNPGFQVGTDFISNNQVSDIDFATVHSYHDQWVSSSDDQAQMSFLNNWLDNHIQDAQNVVRKPLLLAEFGKSSKSPGFSTYQRDMMFHMVYNKIDLSAKSGGAAAGGLFWLLLTEGMDSYRDGYEIILSEMPSTASLIAQQSRRLYQVRKMYARLRYIQMWKRARAIRRAQWWWARNRGSRNIGN